MVSTTTSPVTPGSVLCQMLLKSSSHFTTTDISDTAPASKIKTSGHFYQYFQSVLKLAYRIHTLIVNVSISSKGVLVDGGTMEAWAETVSALLSINLSQLITGSCWSQINWFANLKFCCCFVNNHGHVAHHGVGKNFILDQNVAVMGCLLMTAVANMVESNEFWLLMVCDPAAYSWWACKHGHAYPNWWGVFFTAACLHDFCWCVLVPYLEAHTK